MSGETNDLKRALRSYTADSKEKKEVKQRRFERWTEWFNIISRCKSSSDLKKLQQRDNFCGFFKCMKLYCSFSENDHDAFVTHQLDEHRRAKLHCAYCFCEFAAGKNMAKHMVTIHGKRIYQCSLCLYRAFSKSHVKVHYAEVHRGKPNIHTCESVEDENPEVPVKFPKIEFGRTIRCCVSGCGYNTDSLNKFTTHNLDNHSALLNLSCFVCGTERPSVRELTAHFSEHGIADFECTYCVYGVSNRIDIVNHLSLNHADFPMRLFARPTATIEEKVLPETSKVEAATPNAEIGETFRKLNSNYVGKFYCGVGNCGQILNELESIKDHILNNHANRQSQSTPSPTPTKIAGKRFKNFGQKMFLCSIHGCYYVHTDKEVVRKHCTEMHKNIRPRVIVAISKVHPTRSKRRRHRIR